MKKAINSGLILLSIGALLLSGCGLRQCLHTTMGCEPDRPEREKPCQEFGGPTTGCHSTKPGAYLVEQAIPLKPPEEEGGMRGVRGRDVRAVLAALATAVLAPMGLAQISATPAEAAVPTYGPGNPSFAAYYANPSSMATWAAFCSGAGDGAR